MKTAQPASLPPGVSGSGGMTRSTIASIAVASSAVKNCQGPGRSKSGADVGNGVQGVRSRIMDARVNDVVPANQIAAATRNLRRWIMARPVTAENVLDLAWFLSIPPERRT